MMIVHLETVDSTNEEAKRVPFCHGLCIVAREQTGGKGRRGKKWLSEKDKGLYVSFLLKPIEENITLSSLAFGWAVHKTLKTLSASFYLKWPNDIYINGKKVAGVLPEKLKDRLIVGVGINLLYTKKELAGFPVPATSLLIEKIPFDRELLLTRLHQNIVEVHKLLETGRFKVNLFESCCPMIGKLIKVEEENRSFMGKALGIDREGALIVETENGIARLFSGQVSVREESKGEGNRVSDLQGSPQG